MIHKIRLSILLFISLHFILIHASENHAQRILEKAHTANHYERRIYLAQAIQLGALKAAMEVINSSQWSACTNLDLFTPPLHGWKDDTTNTIEGTTARVIYAELLANWASRQKRMWSTERDGYMDEAANILKNSVITHPIIMNEYLWLWDRVHP
ncbi:MAG: hypothetical protein HRU15_19250, partial [Planctomycetes bacterium]|nr:hypothetical protein [Planctomycetota bacterium]